MYIDNLSYGWCSLRMDVLLMFLKFYVWEINIKGDILVKKK